MSGYNDAVAYADKWINIIKSPSIDEQIAKETVDNFSNHFNKGWVEYRKSVTESGEYAGTEWGRRGCCFPRCVWK